MTLFLKSWRSDPCQFAVDFQIAVDYCTELHFEPYFHPFPWISKFCSITSFNGQQVQNSEGLPETMDTQENSSIR